MKNSLYKNFKTRIDNLISDNNGDNNASNENIVSNEEKIKLHSEFILLRMYVEECMKDIQEDDEDYERKLNSHNRIIDKINTYILKLNLSHRIVGSGIIDIALEYIRLLGVLLTMLSFAIVLTIPCTVFIISDHFLVNKVHLLSNHQRFNIILKRITGYILLMMSGIILVVEDYRNNPTDDDSTTTTTILNSNDDKRSSNKLLGYFTSMPSIDLNGISHRHQYESSTRNSSNMLCFTHASSIDPFVLSVLVVEPSYTFGKSDLFILPFFGWLIAVWGGVSIDRSNQNRAIQTLKSVKNPECVTQWCRTIPSTQDSCCTHKHTNDHINNSNNSHSSNITSVVAIAPEGTRSITGQVLSFKKGPFYLWDHLEQPPIYPLIIMGAYELMPPPYATSKALNIDDTDSKKEAAISNSSSGSNNNLQSYTLLSQTNVTNNMSTNGLIKAATQTSAAVLRVKKILQNRKSVCATPGKVIVRLLPPVHASHCGNSSSSAGLLILSETGQQQQIISGSGSGNKSKTISLDIEAPQSHPSPYGSILNEYKEIYGIDLVDFMSALCCLKPVNSPEQQQQRLHKNMALATDRNSVDDSIFDTIIYNNTASNGSSIMLNGNEDAHLLHDYDYVNTNIIGFNEDCSSSSALSSKSIYRDNHHSMSYKDNSSLIKNEINNNHNNNIASMIDPSSNKIKDYLNITSPSSITTVISREQVSKKLKLSILTSLANNYPSNVGCPLTSLEYRIHLLFLFGFISIDIIVLRYIFYICMMKYYQYSITNVFLLFILYTIIMTMLVYIIKVKMPHYISQ